MTLSFAIDFIEMRPITDQHPDAGGCKGALRPSLVQAKLQI
ncbi:hypothetical protein C7964_1166 [Loktanella sp. PT4BL]|jgi:hypothetical protein|nr:hypothetical protein C7964_1166 [Loktanella sp. PT4BL]